MPIVAQERDLLLSFGSILAALGVAILLQAIMRVSATLLSSSHTITNRNLPHRYKHILLLFLAITLLLLALPTGLAPYISVTAAAFAALAVPHRRTATFVLCVAFMTVAGPRWISTLQLEIPPAQHTWVARYYGQVALWPAERSTLTRYLIIVYNDVRVTRLPCGDHVERRGRISRIYCDAETDNAMTEPMGLNDTRVLVSLGDQTSIYALEGCRDDSLYGNSLLMHQITLLGAKSTLHNLTIRCRLQIPKSDTIRVSPAACLNLVSDVVLFNVRVELYNSTNSEFISSYKIDQANGCTDALGQLQEFNTSHGINVESLLTCIPKLTSRDLLQLIEDQRFVPTVLKKEIPSSLRWMWRAPGILQNIIERVNYTLEHIILPASAFTMTKLSNLFAVLKVFFSYAVERLTPYVYSTLKNTRMLVYGIYCTSTKGMYVSFCKTYDVYDKRDWWYLLGVRIVEFLSNTIGLVLDAVDLVPGLWTAYSFAWRLEWLLTSMCILRTKTVIMKVCTDVVGPLFRLLSLTSSVGIHAILRLAPLCCEVIGFTTITKSIGKFFGFLWYVEMRWLAQEWIFIQKIFWYMYTWFVAVLSFIFSALGVCCDWGYYILGLYTNTSIAAHVFVALIQTVIIVIAMCNEVRDIAKRDSGKYPSFMIRYSGGMVVVMIMTFTRVHSVATIRYLVAHVAVLFMLIGLSVFRIFSKVYNITLYIIFPCISSHVSLEFVSKQPKRSSVIAISIVKGFLVVLVDKTIGNFVSLFLRELFFFMLLVLLLLLVLGVWRKQLHIKLTGVYHQIRLLLVTPQEDPMPLQAAAATNDDE
ncbi:hypothetical protein LSM04_001693 [Trypanosoma melophagium]|uniref:uncharacterized protein n=1 Tax=Trypanosoma melophagium TaxID=715481 RepID=UPI00351A0B4E|nr:hypothetical protein LSM04_001693 [Trypanosoma melophagium]